MKCSKSRSIGVRAVASHLVLGLACAWFAGACSGYYPLGETAQSEELLGSEGPAPREQTGDTRVPASLAPPDVTINGDGSPVSVGDVDGDGRDDMAVGSWDFTSRLSFVHLRYGGPRPGDAEETLAFELSGARLTMADDVAGTFFVFGAGDVDGDGYDDLLMKTNECAATQPGVGTYLLYGGPERLEGVLSVASLAAHFAPPFRQPDPTARYMRCDGYPFAAAPGDLDGDGFDDIVITSAPLLDTDGVPEPGTGEGVYVFYGKGQRFAGDVPFTAADASFHIALPVNAVPLGDVNGDGLADLLVGADVYLPAPPPGSFFVSGRAERWSGAVDLAASATLLEAAFVDTTFQVHSTGDLDGDGLDDVLLRTVDNTRHLFYGAPDLFADGVDFSGADATFGGLAGNVYAVGDRDGDGDDELLDQFYNPDSSLALDFDFFSSNIAMASGSPERLSGKFIFPEREVIAQTPDGPFPDSISRYRNSGRALGSAIPAGDLDGDGAADLFTTSYIYQIIDEDTSEQGSPQMHIHYGATATQTTPLR